MRINGRTLNLTIFYFTLMLIHRGFQPSPVLTYLSLTKGSVKVFQPETNVADFFHFMVLFSKVFIDCFFVAVNEK